jgi:hypothetical protein
VLLLFARFGKTRPQESPRPERFVELARGMGIPPHDAARQVMELMETRAMLSQCGSTTTGS